MVAKVAGDRVTQKYKPIGDKVALQPIKVTETKGGIVLPDAVQDKNPERSPTAWVISVGPDVKQVKPGDLVICYAMTPGMNVIFDGDHLVHVAEENIAGIVDR
jgi:co-chaperonin GroES (HSP10)